MQSSPASLSHLPLEVQDIFVTGATDSSSSDDGSTHVTLTSSHALSTFLHSPNLSIRNIRSLVLLGTLMHMTSVVESPSPTKRARRNLSSPCSSQQSSTSSGSDQISESQLISILQSVDISSLAELHLVRLPFTSLRRRNLTLFTQLLSPSSASSLTTVSIHGAPNNEFQFPTLITILLSLSQLVALSLRHIRAYTVLSSFGRQPSFTLTSFTLHSSPTLSATHFYFLLASTMYADSLHSLSLDHHLPKPNHLRSVPYLGWSVRSFSLSTDQKGVVEGFALNLPNLERFEFDLIGPVNVDIVKMLKGLKQPLKELIDHSREDRQGIDLKVLTLVLEVGWPLHELRKICVYRFKLGLNRLKSVCERKGIELLALDEVSNERGAALAAIQVEPLNP